MKPFVIFFLLGITGTVFGQDDFFKDQWKNRPRALKPGGALYCGDKYHTVTIDKSAIVQVMVTKINDTLCGTLQGNILKMKRKKTIRRKYAAVGLSATTVHITGSENEQYETTSDSTGQFIFPSLAPGKYLITTTCAGYMPMTQVVTVVEERSTGLVILMLAVPEEKQAFSRSK